MRALLTIAAVGLVCLALGLALGRGSHAAPPEEIPKAATAQVAWAAEATALADQALGGGRMTKAQAQRLRALLPKMDGAARKATILKIIRASNDDKLVFEDHELPF